MKLLEDRILISPEKAAEVSPGGVLLPAPAQEKPLRGVIVAVGPGRRLDNGERVKPEVEQGDNIMYGKYSGTEVEVGGEKFIILRECDVLIVL